MKKTAVEYIREKLLGNEYWYEDMTFDQIIDQALAMEKEIIRKAYLDGRDNEYATSKDYYNETFKSE